MPPTEYTVAYILAAVRQPEIHPEWRLLIETGNTVFAFYKYKTKWDGFSDEEATLEPFTSFMPQPENKNSSMHFISDFWSEIELKTPSIHQTTGTGDVIRRRSACKRKRASPSSEDDYPETPRSESPESSKASAKKARTASRAKKNPPKKGARNQLTKEERKAGKVQPLARGLSKMAVPHGKKIRSAEALRQRSAKDAASQAAAFLASTPRFRLDIKLENLKTRSLGGRNKKEDVEKATATVQEMQAWTADARSGIFQDDDGNALLVVISHDAPREAPETMHSGPTEKGASQGDYYHYKVGPEGHPGRSEAELNRLHQPPEFHGFPENEVTGLYEAAQHLTASMQPELSDRDRRHVNETGVMLYTSHDKALPGPMACHPDEENPRPKPDDRASAIKSELCGVTHLVHAWPAQGHPNGRLFPSRDLLGRFGAERAGEVRRYFSLTKVQALRLAEYFKATWPDEYRKYQKAFDAGVWYEEDPGPWIGHALVYKLQVHEHVDGLDDGPTAAYPTGYFTGGEAYFPDLGLKLSYRPGDVLIFLSGYLFHSVGKWQPAQNWPRGSDGLTPGRISHVSFFPRISLSVLEGKTKGWGIRTLSGKYDDPDEQPKHLRKQGKEEKRQKSSLKKEARMARKENSGDRN